VFVFLLMSVVSFIMLSSGISQPSKPTSPPR
jgi:hypothetical protein